MTPLEATTYTLPPLTSPLTSPVFLCFLPSGVLPVFSLVSTLAVCVLFTRVEVLAALQSWGVIATQSSILTTESTPQDNYDNNSNNNNNDMVNSSSQPSTLPIATIFAATLTFTAFFMPPGSSFLWPIQNIVNVCIAVTIGR